MNTVRTLRLNSVAAFAAWIAASRRRFAFLIGWSLVNWGCGNLSEDSGTRPPKLVTGTYDLYEDGAKIATETVIMRTDGHEFYIQGETISIGAGARAQFSFTESAYFRNQVMQDIQYRVETPSTSWAFAARHPNIESEVLHLVSTGRASQSQFHIPDPKAGDYVGAEQMVTTWLAIARASRFWEKKKSEVILWNLSPPRRRVFQFFYECSATISVKFEVHACGVYLVTDGTSVVELYVSSTGELLRASWRSASIEAILRGYEGEVDSPEFCSPEMFPKPQLVEYESANVAHQCSLMECETIPARRTLVWIPDQLTGKPSSLESGKAGLRGFEQYLQRLAFNGLSVVTFPDTKIVKPGGAPLGPAARHKFIAAELSAFCKWRKLPNSALVIIGQGDGARVALSVLKEFSGSQAILVNPLLEPESNVLIASRARQLLRDGLVPSDSVGLRTTLRAIYEESMGVVDAPQSMLDLFPCASLRDWRPYFAELASPVSEREFADTANPVMVVVGRADSTAPESISPSQCEAMRANPLIDWVEVSLDHDLMTPISNDSVDSSARVSRFDSGIANIMADWIARH